MPWDALINGKGQMGSENIDRLGQTAAEALGHFRSFMPESLERERESPQDLR